ncbi:MAG: lipopolysaccharide biosynthesis protein, partial [Desulfovibrio sp.]|nr:lipopolysaccharide biosynthesis protein [Desulfovibrio sp.]
MCNSTPPLARRYAFKLLANMASVPVYLVMEAILPRSLGPAMYGNYSFATNLFQHLSGFLDMGTSTCFYNALSRRQGEIGLVRFYAGISMLVAAITLLASLCMLMPSVGALLMPGVPLWLAPPAALWAFLTWWGRVLRSMNDAVGVTVASEMARTVTSLLSAALLALLFAGSYLNIHSLFVQQYLMLGATACAYWLVTRRHWRVRNQTLRF